MKTFVRNAVMLLAATTACQAGLALAEDIYWNSGASQSTTLVSNEKVAPKEQSPCSACTQEQCGSGESCGCNLGCEDCPSYGIVGFAGLDAFKGISDGSFESNFGAVTGVNAAVPIPGLSDYGFNWQLGLSYGIYDLDGWGDEDIDHRASSQTQTFVTTGFFHKAQCEQRLSYGLVYDWMANSHWGEYNVAPTLGQWRGQAEYALSDSNALGIWGAVRDRSSTQLSTPTLPITDRPISQVNFFWHHKFCMGADSRVWIGIPQTDRLPSIFGNGGGSLGTWTAGASVEAPLSDRLALYANGSYFRPSEAAGALAAIDSGFDVSMGVAWYFGGHAVSHSINGKCGLPYMPMANNSNFLVDQSEYY